MGVYTDREVVVFDLETTGVNVDKDRIVQFAAVRLNEDFEEVDTLELLLNPGIPIDPGASAVHGFTDEAVADEPTFDKVATQVHEYLGDADLAGHNVIAFDLPMLLAEFKRHSNLTLSLERRFFDTLQIFRQYVPHTLEGSMSYYFNESLEGAHDALVDSRAVARVISAQCFRHDLLADEFHQKSMDGRVTLDGKLKCNEDGDIIITFGKYNGTTLKTLAEAERGFLQWMLKKDFSEETKGYVIKALQRTL